MEGEEIGDSISSFFMLIGLVIVLLPIFIYKCVKFLKE